jgi:ribosome maturation factor RimP
MIEEKVRSLLSDCLEERQDLFLITLLVSENNSINVVIDGDNGVLVEDCMLVSRAIEHNIDRDEVDFSLEVSSAGATSPLIHRRQYKKNIDRVLQIKTEDNQKFEGTLVKADENSVVLRWKTREPKPVGKGKVTVEKEVKLNYNEIEKAKVKLKF